MKALGPTSYELSFTSKRVLGTGYPVYEATLLDVELELSTMARWDTMNCGVLTRFTVALGSSGNSNLYSNFRPLPLKGMVE